MSFRPYRVLREGRRTSPTEESPVRVISRTPMRMRRSPSRLEYTRLMRPWRALLGLGLILALAAACTPPPEPEGPRIETAEDLLAALREAGVEVVETAILASTPDLAFGRVVFIGPE